MDSEKLRRFVEIDRRIKAAESEAEDLKKERVRLQAELLDEFADAGIENIRIDGQTVYAHRQVWAKTPDKAAAVAALKALYPELVTETFNSNTLSSLLREREKAGDNPVPPELEGLVEASEVWSLRSRRA
jgi:hypothetical protein